MEAVIQARGSDAGAVGACGFCFGLGCVVANARFFISRRRYRDARKLALDDSSDSSSKRGADGHRTGASWRANESIDCEMGKVARRADGSRLRSDERFSMGLRVSLTAINFHREIRRGATPWESEV